MKTDVHFMIAISAVLRMRNVSHKSCEKLKTLILYSAKFFKNRAVCEILTYLLTYSMEQSPS